MINRIIAKIGFSPNRRRVLGNVYWAVLGKVVNVLGSLLVGVMVARYLGPERFGLMNYVVSFVAIFSVFACFGLNSIEVRELSKRDADTEVILGTAFILRLVFAALAMLFLLLTIVRFEADPFTIAMVLTYSLVMLLASLDVIKSYYTAILQNKYIIKSEIFRTLAGMGVKVGLLVAKCSLAWFIVAAVFDFALVGSGYIYCYQRQGKRLRCWRWNSGVAWMLIRESFPLLLSGTAIVIYSRINAVMIGKMMDLASVGLFSVASRIVELGVFIPLVIAQTVTPLLVQAHEKDPVVYRKQRQQFMDTVVWSAVPIALIFSVGAAPAILILYGPSYSGAVPALQIMAWRTVFMALFAASGQLIIVEGLQRYAAVRNIASCFLSILLNYLLIPLWGVVGSSIAVVLTVAFSGYFSHFMIRPYWYMVPIQTKSIFFGWKQLLIYLTDGLHKGKS